MSESGAEIVPNPERAVRVELVKELHRRGIASPDTIGYHGTSIQSFKAFVETGNFPGSTEPPHPLQSFPQPGDVYFFPFSAVGSHMDDSSLLSRHSCLEGARDYATLISKAHQLLTDLDVPLARSDMLQVAYDISNGTSVDMLENMDDEKVREFLSLRPKKAMERIIAEAKKARGVIVAIRDTVGDIVEPADSHDAYKINMRRITPQQAFSGLQPLGSPEADYFLSVH